MMFVHSRHICIFWDQPTQALACTTCRWWHKNALEPTSSPSKCFGATLQTIFQRVPCLNDKILEYDLRDLNTSSILLNPVHCCFVLSFRQSVRQTISSSPVVDHFHFTWVPKITVQTMVLRQFSAQGSWQSVVLSDLLVFFQANTGNIGFQRTSTKNAACLCDTTIFDSHSTSSKLTVSEWQETHRQWTFC